MLLNVYQKWTHIWQMLDTLFTANDNNNNNKDSTESCKSLSFRYAVIKEYFVGQISI